MKWGGVGRFIYGVIIVRSFKKQIHENDSGGTAKNLISRSLILQEIA